MNIAVWQQLGIPLADLQCMGLLAAGPSAPSALAGQLGLTTGAMTKVLDRLEQGSYVTQSADPCDRRRVVIAADLAGLAELAGYYAAMSERMSRQFDGYTDAHLATIFDFMQAGRRETDEEIERIRSQGLRHATRRPRETAPLSSGRR
jgi:DNA-binding MarR family transcriptional regulator